MKFQVGDRVVVYTNNLAGDPIRVRGKINDIKNHILTVDSVGFYKGLPSFKAHVKQCRKLVSKKSVSTWFKCSLENIKKRFFHD